ncbi:hypothetical protein DP107_13600 [Haloglomus irregulare]|uniref:Uncharacterized protein n=1 Tax=Haloglomus irregulare TaxID=2234134 RepID=A0A554MY01_9EURY|nr:hypothetical protein DP107_13600 [Haloglomus irregulare]
MAASTASTRSRWTSRRSAAFPTAASSSSNCSWSATTSALSVSSSDSTRSPPTRLAGRFGVGWSVAAATVGVVSASPARISPSAAPSEPTVQMTLMRASDSVGRAQDTRPQTVISAVATTNETARIITTRRGIRPNSIAVSSRFRPVHSSSAWVISTTNSVFAARKTGTPPNVAVNR